MPRSISGFNEYGRAHANDQNWAGWCERWVYRSGGFTESFSSALLAAQATIARHGPLNPDISQAPVGAFVYYDNVWDDGEDMGHIAGVYQPGDNPLLNMASSHVTDDWGNNAGTVDYETYSRVGPRLLGWSLYHGSEKLTDSTTGGGTSGGGSTPITNRKRKAATMTVKYIRNFEDGRIGMFTEGAGVKVFGSQSDYDNHRRIIKSFIDNDAQGKKQYNAGILTLPPQSNKTTNFFGVSTADWNLEVAVAGGYY